VSLKRYRDAGYAKMLEDPNVKRWYSNNGKGSVVVADVYLRSLGRFCKAVQLTPAQFAELPLDKMEDMTQDFIDGLENSKEGYSPGYIESYLKAVKSWAAWVRKPLQRKIRIRDAGKRPTLENEVVPSQDMLGKVLYADSTPLRTRVGIALIAFAGCRPEVQGDYAGLDGLKVKDFPEMEIKGKEVAFSKIPTKVVVRDGLSKSGKEYFSFLGMEGCGIVKEYLERRLRQGEELTPDSGIIVTSQFQANKAKALQKALGIVDASPFSRTTKISDTLREAMRAVGIPYRPYVWRAYFDTNLMLAESKGLITHAYVQFIMGHVGDIEAQYTTNRHILPERVLEDMRGAYKRALDLLQTGKPEGRSEEELKMSIKREMLLVTGYTQEELSKVDLSQLGSEEVQKMVRDKLLGGTTPNGRKQKVVKADEIDKYLAEGWEWVGDRSNGDAILKAPAP
jgi:integrase